MNAQSQVKSEVQNRNGSPRGKKTQGAKTVRSRSFFLAKKFPKYQIHKATNRAFVWWDDRREYLGNANSPESLDPCNHPTVSNAHSKETACL